MIIIKTKNGDRFINENYALEVEHNKSECQVRILPAQWGAATPPQGYVIKDVEQVTYTTKDTEVKDTGSEIERLQKHNSELWKLKEFYRRLTQKYECFYHNIISNPNDIKDKLIQLQADIKEINDDFEKNTQL